MAQTHIVYTDVAQGAMLTGTLFQNKKFWLSRTVPLRIHISEQITNNGGRLVELEKDADIRIVDHARKHNPPGTYSFKYVTESVRNGRLEDLEEHLAGPPEGTTRNVGSAKPTKGSRTPFTKEDDEVLLNWVKDYEYKGGKILGNEIYKQLEATNPRHTFQSWRDRYLKYLSNRPKPTPPRSESSPNSSNRPVQAQQQTDSERDVQPKPFTEEEHAFLLKNVDHIMTIADAALDELWAKVAENYTNHTKEEWRNYYEKNVLSAYRSAGVARNGVSSAARKGSPHSTEPLAGSSAVRSNHNTPTAQRHSSSPCSSKLNSPVTSRRVFEMPRNSSSKVQQTSPQRQATQRGVTPSSPLAARGDQTITPRPPKRKATELEKGDVSSPVSKDVYIHTAKRRRMTTVLVDKEVPSTPERHPRSSARGAAKMHDEENGRIDNGRTLNQSPASQTLTEPEPDVPTQKKKYIVEETQMNDVLLQEPDDEWGDDLDAPDEFEPLSTPRLPGKSAMEDRQDILHDPMYDESAELDQWIDRHVEAGYSEDEVIFALKRTSMDARLAELVLESLAKGESLPHNIPGIWSEAEDEVIRGGNQRALRKLERKHGLEAFDARLKFLREYEDAAVGNVD